jgi:hypothetical protein
LTATEVDGLAVVDDEPLAAPFKNRAGEPVLMHRTRVLTLVDGSVIYGCAECDYTNPNPHSIRPHLNKHSTKPRVNGTLNMSVKDLMRRLESFGTLSEDRDKWKDRALTAERRLKQLRSALGVTV